MRLRPSRIARESGGPSARVLRRLSAELGQHERGQRRARGTVAFARTSSPLQQRSLVKISFARNKGRGAWRAQGRYLSRAGAQREGARGLGFDAERDDLDLPERLDSWQKAGDVRLWKIVVSPEAGARLDLPEHARQLMTQIQDDLGTRLEWVAIDHHDTAHPHVHIVVRGVDDEGKALVLARDYIRTGIRARSQEILTRTLGHRQEHEHQRARENAIEAPRLTEIDRSLLARADASGTVSFDAGVPSRPIAQERRLQDLRRLQYLESIGLAERLGPKRWQLSPELGPALRQIQIAGDVQKTLARSRTLVSDRDAPLVLTRMAAGVEVTGRVTGGGIDESRDEPLLIVEGTDGRRHLIPQTPEIVAARGDGRLRPGSIVTLRGDATMRTEARTMRTEILEHGPLRDLKRAETASTLLDRDALRSVRETGALPTPAPDRRGFFRQWRAAVRARGPVLEREGLLRRSRDAGSERTFEVEKGAERMVEGRMVRGERVPTTLRDLERIHGKDSGAARAEPGRAYQGPVVGYAVEDDGKSYVVLDTEQELTAVPTDRRDLEVGHTVRARAEATAEKESHERRTLTWVLDDVEHERDRDRGR
jgi:type IV secretory pathway VirD2 relaxase